MPNIKLQDVMIFVNGTSRYNNNAFDTVLVKTLLYSDEPIQEEYYVPSGVTANPEIFKILDLQGLEITPFKASTLLEGTEDIREQALNGNPAETLSDAAKLLLLSLMKKSQLVPVAGSKNTYELTYEYKIFPQQSDPNSYEFEIRVPFDGLGIHPQGGRIEVTAVLPRMAELDGNATKGVDEQGVEVNEIPYPTPNVNRKIVTFAYQKDPLFTIRYIHKQGLQN
ncbi:hypothetical protein DZB84_20560 [Bacillus sp. HNG]|uniref:hypothetical protein n=1 Tax=Bacillus sp. HNG TaxID=2293325 RepID=UPI000E2F6710|nr:hypothetical protein [Bacillus sp. HNG]RFB11462.1 hypothetical protein DZB84_20560 [Bacillus sp. HNG]